MTAKAPKQSSLTIRLDTELSERFKQVSKDNDRNQSQLIREWIREYCRKNGQAKLF